MEVNRQSSSADLSIYNTTPTPQNSSRIFFPNTQSSHISLRPTSSCLKSFLHSILLGMQKTWNWVKENIFCIKKNPFPSNFSFSENPIECLKDERVTYLAQVKRENPKQFLENIVDWFFKDPKAFVEGVNTLPQYFFSDDNFKIAYFLTKQSKLWCGKTAKRNVLNKYLVLFLYGLQDKIGVNESKKAAICDFVAEINQKYDTPENDHKISQLRADTLYSAVTSGNTEQFEDLMYHPMDQIYD